MQTPPLLPTIQPGDIQYLLAVGTRHKLKAKREQHLMHHFSLDDLLVCHISVLISYIYESPPKKIEEYSFTNLDSCGALHSFKRQWNFYF